MIALDASALLAFLFREQGAERVAAHLSESCLSAVNLAEVIGRFVRDGHDAHEVLARLAASETELVPFTPEQAAIAAQLMQHVSLSAAPSNGLGTTVFWFHRCARLEPIS